MKLVDQNTYILSTGRQVYANNSIIGLSISEEDSKHTPFGVYEGYDGYVGIDHKTVGWTKAEQLELIAYMIAAWTSFKDQLTANVD